MRPFPSYKKRRSLINQRIDGDGIGIFTRCLHKFGQYENFSPLPLLKFCALHRQNILTEKDYINRCVLQGYKLYSILLHLQGIIYLVHSLNLHTNLVRFNK